MPFCASSFFINCCQTNPRPSPESFTHVLKVMRRGNSCLRHRSMLALGDGSKRRCDDIEAFVKLFIADHQRCQNSNNVVVSARCDCDEAVLVTKLRGFSRFSVGGFARFCVAGKFDGAHPAKPAPFTPERPFFFPSPAALFAILAPAP